MSESLEIEVKYLLTDLGAIRNRILESGGVSLGRHFESNIRFEDRTQSLKEKKQLLRLRQDRKATLTFKSTPETEDPRYKILKELEVEVSCFETMRAILKALDFMEVQVYEKWRETFETGQTLICIDEMPFADFIEIEGPPKEIDALSDALGFSQGLVITANYLDIFARIRELEDLDFRDVTFDNFRGRPKDYTPHIRAFQRGPIF